MRSQGVEGAIWPLISNIFIMLVVTITLFWRLYNPSFITEVKWGGRLVGGCIVGDVLAWSLFFICCFSNPGYIATSSVSY